MGSTLSSLRGSKSTNLDVKYHRFSDENLLKEPLAGHHSRIYGVDIVHSESLQSVFIVTVGKDGKMQIHQIRDEHIGQFAVKKRKKLKNCKKTTTIHIGTSYSLTCGATYNDSLDVLLVADGGLNSVCSIYRADDRRVYREIGDGNHGYTAHIDFVDGTNLVLVGWGDGSLRIYDYVSDQELLSMTANSEIVATSHHLEGGTMTIAYSDTSGNVFIDSLEICDDTQSLKVLQSQKLVPDSESSVEVNCIAISPGGDCGKYIICGLEDASIAVLSQRQIDAEYEVMIREETGRKLSLFCCCWVDETSFILGEDEKAETLIRGTIRDYSEREYLDIVAASVAGVRLIATLICEFCGCCVETAPIQTLFADNKRVSGLCSLPHHETAPGLFVAASWDNTANMFVPRV